MMITYFSYQQIWIVETFLYNQKLTDRNHPGYHLLKYIGIDPPSIQFEFIPSSANEDLYNRLENIGYILNKQQRIIRLEISETNSFVYFLVG